MPLIEGDRAGTKEGIAENIRRLIEEDNLEQEDAVGIAFRIAREVSEDRRTDKKKPNIKKKLP